MAKSLLSCDHQVDKLVNEKGLAVSDRVASEMLV